MEVSDYLYLGHSNSWANHWGKRVGYLDRSSFYHTHTFIVEGWGWRRRRSKSRVTWLLYCEHTDDRGVLPQIKDVESIHCRKHIFHESLGKPRTTYFVNVVKTCLIICENLIWKITCKLTQIAYLKNETVIKYMHVIMITCILAYISTI
jgi:hypothetical protein